jgi:hypothetical protein
MIYLNFIQDNGLAKAGGLMVSSQVYFARLEPHIKGKKVKNYQHQLYLVETHLQDR